MRPHRLAPLLAAACAVLGACDRETALPGKRDAGPDAGLPGDAGALDAGTPFAGTLRITPRDPLLRAVYGQARPTLQFEARADGAPVSPIWKLDTPGLGAIDATGLFTANGNVGGHAKVTATYGLASDSTTVTVHLEISENGAPDGGEAADGGSGAPDAGSGAGGWGGVGGEGLGGAVDEATLEVFEQTPSADPGLALLYPYDGTVWPRGILAPLLQWAPGGRDYDAVELRLDCPAFSYRGTFARTAAPFLHHPIPPAAWERMNDACAGKDVSLRLVLASGGQSFGPLTATWRIASGFLKGVIYYNSYGTNLAKNYSGALGGDGRFGGATLAIRGGSTDPSLVAGGDGAHESCRVCHVVSADGSTMLAQRGDVYAATSAYALDQQNAETRMSPEDGRFAWAGLDPTGTFALSNSSPIAGSSSLPSALYSVPDGAPIATNGLPAGLRAGTPVFSHDGLRVAFNWYGGEVDGQSGDRRSLAAMRFMPPDSFGEFQMLFTPPEGQTAVYPSFLPAGDAVVFELELVYNGRAFGETRSTCDGSGPCSDVGTRAELWWADLATGQAHPLDRLNGKGYLPTAPAGHEDDATLNYEPTVSPVASGGYAWVIFTSRRLYGNIATINPFWSDPRFHDISEEPTPKKLWVAALDLDAEPGTDPSHPAFYVPAQELLAGNSRGYWAVDPCRDDGERCESGDQCCGGFCRPTGELGKVCGTEGPGCAEEFEKCESSTDCCTGRLRCVNGRCTLYGPN